MKAKDFSLQDQEGKTHTLADYKGKWLVMYFYPRDNTPGCTLEAQGFRRLKPEFAKKGVEVIGVSTDTVDSHQKFAASQKLNFPILSDCDHGLIAAYGSWGVKKFMGREFKGTKRQTVIINPDGEIVKKYEEVKPVTHPEQVLDDLDRLMI